MFPVRLLLLFESGMFDGRMTAGTVACSLSVEASPSKFFLKVGLLSEVRFSN
jgi:hypothetical protein